MSRVLLLLEVEIAIEALGEARSLAHVAVGDDALGGVAGLAENLR
jgi:hypothetical protein